MIFFCEHCGVRFKRDGRAVQTVKHCSYGCKAAATRKVSADVLRRWVFAGASSVEMARELGVSRRIVWKWIKRDGLLQTWREQRFA